MKNRFGYIMVVLLVMQCFPAFSQSFRNNMMWRTMRNELMFGGGVSNIMSDLGGRDMIGTDFLWDLETSKFKQAFNFNYGLYLSEKLVWRTRFTYGRLEGDDKLTKEPFRMNRNLHVRNDIIETATTLEFFFLNEKGGNRYGLRNKKGVRGRKIGAKMGGIGGYVFLGFGGFYHNPKAYYVNQWIPLKPLRTEGQGLPDGPDEYKQFVACIPMGFGFRKSIGSTGQWYIGLEMSYRFTFTDYLDDVSGYYYDKNVIQQAANDAGENAPAALYLADPNLFQQGLGENPNPWTTGVYMTDVGQMRGDITDRDGYLFAMVNIYYKIKKQPKRYTSLRRKRYRASF
jgi:hypothetical protein